MTTATGGNGPRFAERPIADGGTSTSDWRRWAHEFPTLELSDCPALVVVAPHPDDETLGFGAAASLVKARGIDVTVVCVSDGEGSVAGLSPLERRWLADDRRAEVRNAASILGLGEPVFLGLPDGAVADCEVVVTEVLGGMLGDRPPGTWCACTWRGDGHPDHEAVGRAAAAAVDRSDATLLEYPVWMWHWAQPGDDAVPWHRMSVVPNDGGALARKRRAVAAFESQLKPYEPDLDPVLPAFVIDRLFAVGEAVFL
jgi:LmbE family N-acetylglucosaminyl deacetylase